MKKDPEIAFRDIDASEAVEAKIRERIERLERYTDELIGCRVVVETPHRHQNKGKIYKVSLELSVPGENIFVNRNPEDDQSREDIYVSIRDAFNAAERQLKEFSERRRGQTKQPQPDTVISRGTVSRLFPDEDYGFITPKTGGAHIYFHANAIVDEEFESLEVGTPVRFHEEEGDEGPQASSVHVLSEQETIPGS